MASGNRDGTGSARRAEHLRQIAKALDMPLARFFDTDRPQDFAQAINLLKAIDGIGNERLLSEFLAFLDHKAFGTGS